MSDELAKFDSNIIRLRGASPFKTREDTNMHSMSDELVTLDPNIIRLRGASPFKTQEKTNMHSMSDELVKIDSNIIRLTLRDLKKKFAAVLASGYIFFSMLPEQEKTVPVVSFM